MSSAHTSLTRDMLAMPPLPKHMLCGEQANIRTDLQMFGAWVLLMPPVLGSWGLRSFVLGANPWSPQAVANHYTWPGLPPFRIGWQRVAPTHEALPRRAGLIKCKVLVKSTTHKKASPQAAADRAPCMRSLPQCPAHLRR